MDPPPPPLGSFTELTGASFGSPNPRSDTTQWLQPTPTSTSAQGDSTEPLLSVDEPTIPSLSLPRRPTLAERASRASKDRSFILGLSLETIQASSRDAEDIPGISSDSVCKARFRGWHITEEGRHIPTTCPGALRISSYNLCAARYLTTDRYPLCPTWAMPDSYRAKQMYREIRGCDPDIAAFQEMSIDMFQHVDITNRCGGAADSHATSAAAAGVSQPLLLGDLLRADGYEGHHAVITDKNGDVCHTCGGSSGKEIRAEFEGVAVFYKTSRFSRLEHVPVPFNLIARQDRTLRSEERQRVQLASHNVGLVVVLQDIVSSGILIIGTLHAAWDAAQRPECQQYQIHHLAKKMEELKSMYEDIGEVSVLMLGDFNAELNSYALNYATVNQLDHQRPAVGGAKCEVTASDDAVVTPLVGAVTCGNSHGSNSPGALGSSSTSSNPSGAALLWPPTKFADWHHSPPSHSLVLSDAYVAYCKKYPSRVSAVNPSAGGEGKVIDHVLFDRRSYVCVAVGKLDDRKDVPTKDVPSDHYLIAVTLVPLHAVAFSTEPLIASEGEDD